MIIYKYLRILFFLSVLVFSKISFANAPIPGFIPRFYSIEAATDLSISPEIAHQRALNGQDISLLDPKKDTQIWDPQSNKIQETIFLDSPDVQFVSGLKARIGKIRFTVKNSRGELLNVYLTKKVHSFLLRKNILEKIGYKVPNMQWIPNLKIKFSNNVDRDILLEDMKDDLLADPKRWVVEKKDAYLEVQDALVMAADTKIYNLALGYMTPSVHQGRRLLRAPYIPLSLVDTPESINLFSWEAGHTVSDQIQLYHSAELANSYQTSYEDARWVMRRIAKLTRMDLEEVVDKSYLPEEVSALLKEKIVSRRNDLLHLLKLDEEFSEIPFSPTISMGEYLQNGEVKKEFFDGYVSRFSFGDPESPFSNSELGSYALAEGQSEIMRTATQEFNKLIATQDENAIKEKLKNIIINDGPDFPTQAVIVPTASGSVILSRDIIAGSYQGTDNKVQLVDNIGFNISLGAKGALVGIPEEISFNGQGGVSFQRTYTHVKPIVSLKKALKEPYRNLIVPFTLQEIGKEINQLKKSSGEDQELKQSVVEKVKKILKVGESIIITESLAPNLAFQLGVSLSQLASLDPKLLKLLGIFQSSKINISRMHIFRANEDTIHVYQDTAEGLDLLLSLKLESYIPIFSITGHWLKARAQTKFYPITLSSASTNVLKAFRTAVLTTSDFHLKEEILPHVINHKIGESSSSISFLFQKSNRIKTNHSVEIEHNQGGESFRITRRYDSWTKGQDYEGFARDTLNLLVKNLLEVEWDVSTSPLVNPGFTVKGKAHNKIMATELGNEQKLYTTYQRVYNGWEIKRKELKRKLSNLNDEFGGDLFDPLSYQNTNSIMLYQLQMRVLIENDGIHNVLGMSVDDFENVIKNFSIEGLSAVEQRTYSSAIRDAARKFYSQISRVQKEIADNDYKKALIKWHLFLNDFLDLVTVKGLENVCGEANIVYYGRIDGFRQGEENGDQAIVSDIFGTLPLELQSTPSQYVIQRLGILPGELYANWLTDKAL